MKKRAGENEHLGSGAYIGPKAGAFLLRGVDGGKRRKGGGWS